MKTETISRWLAQATPAQRARVKVAIEEAYERWIAAKVNGKPTTPKQIEVVTSIAREVAVLCEVWRDYAGRG